MAYTKTNWVNGGPPAISAENLNNMESGIYDNDAKITAIQEWISNNIQMGSVSSISVAANSYTEVAITFSPTMASVPVVLATLESASTAGAIGSLEVVTNNITTSGFTARLFNAGSQARVPGFRWIAIAK